MGSIVTFYSYKGGVGRSMALANIGVILTNWGKKVLLIDWDLEAPGLEDYFKSLISDFNTLHIKEGLIDLMQKKVDNLYLKSSDIKWEDYLTSIYISNSSIHLLTSGKKDDQYVNKVRQLDFLSFYNDHDGGDFLEEIRTYWKKNYDFVLIDSRTGLTDSSGICSIHMPDILVLMFTATEQGFKGILNVVNKSKEKQDSLIYDRLKLKILPIATRFDNSELKLTEEWLDRFATDLKDVYGDFIPQDKEGNDLIQPIEILKKTKVPYISFYSYGEKLPILEQGTDDPNSLGYVYETIAAIITNNFQNIDKLKEERDSYIKIGKGEEIFDHSYYQRQIDLEKEEKRKLELELKLKDEKIQNQIQSEQEHKKKLEEELRLKITSEQNLKNQVKKSKQVLYVVIGIVILALFIWFFATRNKGYNSSYDSTGDSTTTTITTDSVTIPSDSAMAPDSAVKMAVDTAKK